MRPDTDVAIVGDARDDSDLDRARLTAGATVTAHVSMDTVPLSAPLIIFQVPWVSLPATTMWMSAGSKMRISSSGAALSRGAEGGRAR